jgi:hypothetical protein
MVAGEKLWEGKGKYGGTGGLSIKAVSPGGLTIEGTNVVQLKGIGRAKGIDGTLTFTSTMVMEQSGAAWTHGQGMFNTITGEMAVVKASGIGKMGKVVMLMSFMTMSQKLIWMNDLVAIVTQEGDPQWTEFEIAIQEWK